MTKIGNPVLPIFSKNFILPFGSKIKEIDVTPTQIYEFNLNKTIVNFSKPYILNFKINKNQISEKLKNIKIFQSNELYPTESFNYTIRTGLLGNKHVTYLNLQLFPIRLSTIQNKIFFSKCFDIKVIFSRSVHNPIDSLMGSEKS